ncbi:MULTISPECIES: hypothetical protein [unclassified Mesorhizobium]|uniref:hypothetical protein n=1 Tax=unclassified Mesorhizobium TaxID=325217 RepID=UPI0012DFA25D|nr:MULTISPECIES: hypothetical protein [unclassified Mesorhizobium]
MTKQARLNEWTGHQWAAPRERFEQAQNLCKLIGKSQQTQVRATGSRRLSGLSGDKADVGRQPMHVAENCAAVLGQRHASKQENLKRGDRIL